MKATTLLDFFEGKVPAEALAADLSGAFERTGQDTYELRMADLTAAYQVLPQHLVALCDAVGSGGLDPEALRAVGFGLLASDKFEWDGDAVDGAVVSKTLHDWASPEANFRLTKETVRKFRERLTTGKDTFARSDFSEGSKARVDRWKLA